MKMLKSAVSKINKGVAAKVSVLSTAMMMAAMPAFAATSEPKIVRGTIDMAGDLLTWTLALIPVCAVALIGYHGWMKSLAEDPNAVADRNKKMKNVGIGSAVGVCSAGLVKLFLGYYNSSVSGKITDANAFLDGASSMFM